SAIASLNSRPCSTSGRICSTHSSGIRSTRFRPSARKVRDQTGCPSPSAHRQLGLPQRRCVRASEPGRASGGIRRLRSKACLRWRKRAAGSPFASYQFICVSYNTQIAYCQHNSSGGGICARHRCRIFNVYVVLQGWAGSPVALHSVAAQSTRAHPPRESANISRARNQEWRAQWTEYDQDGTAHKRYCSLGDRELLAEAIPEPQPGPRTQPQKRLGGAKPVLGPLTTEGDRS